MVEIFDIESADIMQHFDATGAWMQRARQENIGAKIMVRHRPTRGRDKGCGGSLLFLRGLEPEGASSANQREAGSRAEQGGAGAEQRKGSGQQSRGRRKSRGERREGKQERGRAERAPNREGQEGCGGSLGGP